jgi:hypothetical protein
MYNGPARYRPWPSRAGLCWYSAGRIAPRDAPDRASTVPGARPRPVARSVGHFVGPFGPHFIEPRANPVLIFSQILTSIFPKM